MRARLAGLALAATTLGWGTSCETGGGGGGGDDLVFDVECTGMQFATALAGQRNLSTRYNDRCVVAISDTFWGGDVTLWTSGGTMPQNGMTLQIAYGDDVWVARSGSVTVDLADGDVAMGEGTYDIQATSQNDDRVARLRGPIQWCDFTVRDDCPYASTSGLEKSLELDLWGGPLVTEGTQLTDCRVLIDPARAGAQVDLQIGVLNGVNADAWPHLCDLSFALPQKLQFQIPTVTGPGTYDLTAQAFPHPNPTYTGQQLVLPAIDLQLPILWFGATSCFEPTKMVRVGSSVGLGYPPSGPTQCSFVIDETNGRFEADCTNVSAAWGYDFPGATDLRVAADCDVRYVGG